MCFLCGSLVQCGTRDLNSESGDVPPLSGMTGGFPQVFRRAPAGGRSVALEDEPVSNVQSSIWETRSLQFSLQGGSPYCLHQNHGVIFEMQLLPPYPRSIKPNISEMSPESCSWWSYLKGSGKHWIGVNKFQFILYLQTEPLNSLFWPEEEPILVMCIGKELSEFVSKMA